MHKKVAGFIFNDCGTAGKHFPHNVLHIAGCYTVKRMDTNTGKYHFDSIEEARDWLEGNRGVEGEKWRTCRSCL